jgi:four helix bundle protein
MTTSPAKTKSYAFSIKMVSLCRRLMVVDKEYVISKQLLKSSTSIGANIEEAIGGFSRNDFKYKISISYKEARETRYWIRLLISTDYFSEEEGASALADLDELMKMLMSTLKTLNKV